MTDAREIHGEATRDDECHAVGIPDSVKNDEGIHADNRNSSSKL